MGFRPVAISRRRFMQAAGTVPLVMQRRERDSMIRFDTVPARQSAPVYLADLNRAEPKSRLSREGRRGCWRTLEYQTDRFPGTMLFAGEETQAGEITLDLGRSGWHDVYLGDVQHRLASLSGPARLGEARARSGLVDGLHPTSQHASLGGAAGRQREGTPGAGRVLENRRPERSADFLPPAVPDDRAGRPGVRQCLPRAVAGLRQAGSADRGRGRRLRARPRPQRHKTSLRL